MPAGRDHDDLFSRPDPGGTDGYSRWREGRDSLVHRIAQATGLPINHWVQVVLQDGVRLEGWLRLREERLFRDPDEIRSPELTVDGVCFRPSEVESCLRLDGPTDGEV